MTLEEFDALEGFPTPAEFVAFARARGWRFHRNPDGRARMWTPSKSDPLALAFVELIKVEPLRSSILAAAAGGDTAPAPEAKPEPPPPEPVAETPVEVEPWTCDVCGKLICVTPDEWRAVAGSPLFCDRAGAREARGIGGRVVPAVPRCPFKPGDRV